MTSEQLTTWREHLGWSQAEAARQLDLSSNAYGALEAGHYLDGRKHDGPVRIKRHIALACAAIAFGLPEWNPEQETSIVTAIGKDLDDIAVVFGVPPRKYSESDSKFRTRIQLRTKAL